LRYGQVVGASDRAGQRRLRARPPDHPRARRPLGGSRHPARHHDRHAEARRARWTGVRQRPWQDRQARPV